MTPSVRASRWPVPPRHRDQRTAGDGGWHGVAFDKPVRRTARPSRSSAPSPPAPASTTTAGLRHPLPGSEGRAIRSLMPPTHLPIYVASLGPASRLTASSPTGGSAPRVPPRDHEGCSSTRSATAPRAPGEPSPTSTSPSPSASSSPTTSTAERRHAEGYAFTIGAMGSAGTNFYNDAFERQGFGDDVREVQRLWLAGRTPPGDRSPTPSGSAPTSSAPTTSSRPTPPLLRRRHHHTARQPPGGPDIDLDHQLGDLERLLELVRQVNDEGGHQP